MLIEPRQVKRYGWTMLTDAIPVPGGLRLTGVILAVSFGALFAGHGWTGTAMASATDWISGPKSRARLIAADGLRDAHYLTGVEIRLAPDNLTYWRQPGDAGVPPVFSFEGSQNLAAAEVRYPAPHRFPEAGGEAFGYRDSVVFPLLVTPADPGRPVVLAVKLAFATCDKICVPAEFTGQIGLSPGPSEGSEAAILRDWMARTPSPAGISGAPAIAVAPLAAGASWKVNIAPGSGAGSDLFAEGPDGWYFDTRPSGEGFELSLAQKPADAPAGPVEITLTLVSGACAFETRTSLDVATAKP